MGGGESPVCNQTNRGAPFNEGTLVSSSSPIVIEGLGQNQPVRLWMFIRATCVPALEVGPDRFSVSLDRLLPGENETHRVF